MGAAQSVVVEWIDEWVKSHSTGHEVFGGGGTAPVGRTAVTNPSSRSMWLSSGPVPSVPKPLLHFPAHCCSMGACPLPVLETRESYVRKN